LKDFIMQNSTFSPNAPRLVINSSLHFTPRAAHKLLLKGELPPCAIIDGALTFEPGSEPIFPSGVHVCGSLSVAWCGDGLKLGSDLTVDGMADFSMTSMAAIPRRLHVKMALDVSHTYIADFPLDMQVGWKIIVGGNVTRAMRNRVVALETQNAADHSLRLANNPK
jgi:hypothetical protein